jgi:hypothetical protein
MKPPLRKVASMDRVFMAGATALLVACGGATKDPAAGQRIRQLAVGREQICVVRESGALECFASGSSLAEAASPLAGRFRRVSVGYAGGAALREDGVAEYWGVDDDSLPTGTFLELASDANAACGIRPDGSMECGGLDGTFERTPLPGRFTQVLMVATAGVCGVTDSGQLLCHQGQPWSVPPPEGLDDLASVAIELTASSGGCGLTRAGALHCWGHVCAVAGRYRAVTLTHLDTCVLAQNGELSCWPNGSCGPDGSPAASASSRVPPPGAFAQLAASLDRTCAVNAAGDDVLCW